MARAVGRARRPGRLSSTADTADFGRHFVYGLLGPLLASPGCGSPRRPTAGRSGAGDGEFVDDAGRVTELTAKPLFNALLPRAVRLRPAAVGRVDRDAASCCARFPFCTGYAVETAMMIDVLRAAGLDAMAQVDLGTRHNRSQPLFALGTMAYAVVRAVLMRAEAEGAARIPAPTPTATCTPTAPRTASGSRSAWCGSSSARRWHDAGAAADPWHCAASTPTSTARCSGAARVAAARRRGQLLDARGAGARGLRSRRRRGRAEVGPAQAAGRRGRAPDRPALLHLRDGLRSGRRRRGACSSPIRSRADGERSVHDQIERVGRAVALLFENFPGRLEYHSPWHHHRAVHAPVARQRRPRRRRTRCWPSTATTAYG